MNTHISSSTEGYFVMNGSESDYNAERKILAGPFASKQLAEDFAPFVSVTADSGFDTGKFAGTLIGVLGGNRHNLASMKTYMEQHGAFNTLTPENTHWQRLDDMICRIDALEAVFQAYIHDNRS